MIAFIPFYRPTMARARLDASSRGYHERSRIARTRDDCQKLIDINYTQLCGQHRDWFPGAFELERAP